MSTTQSAHSGVFTRTCRGCRSHRLRPITATLLRSSMIVLAMRGSVSRIGRMQSQFAMCSSLGKWKLARIRKVNRTKVTFASGNLYGLNTQSPVKANCLRAISHSLWRHCGTHHVVSLHNPPGAPMPTDNLFIEKL